MNFYFSHEQQSPLGRVRTQVVGTGSGVLRAQVPVTL